MTFDGKCLRGQYEENGTGGFSTNVLSGTLGNRKYVDSLKKKKYVDNIN